MDGHIRNPNMTFENLVATTLWILVHYYATFDALLTA